MGCLLHIYHPATFILTVFLLKSFNNWNIITDMFNGEMVSLKLGSMLVTH